MRNKPHPLELSTQKHINFWFFGAMPGWQSTLLGSVNFRMAYRSLRKPLLVFKSKPEWLSKNWKRLSKVSVDHSEASRSWPGVTQKSLHTLLGSNLASRMESNWKWVGGPKLQSNAHGLMTCQWVMTYTTSGLWLTVWETLWYMKVIMI